LVLFFSKSSYHKHLILKDKILKMFNKTLYISKVQDIFPGIILTQ